MRSVFGWLTYCTAGATIAVLLPQLGGPTQIKPLNQEEEPAVAGSPWMGNTDFGVPATSGTTEVPGMPTGTGDTPWMDTANRYVGMREAGTNRGAMVDQWNTAVGNSPGDPWCAAFVNSCLGANGVEGTNSGWSQSFRNWGTDAGGPVAGSVAVLSYGNGHGHVGFVQSVNPDGTVNILGGNQSDGVTVSRFSRSQIVGYRLPPGSSGGGQVMGNNQGELDVNTR